MERAIALRKKSDFVPEEKDIQGNSITIYQCKNSNTVLFEKRYGEEAYRLVQFRTDGDFEWVDYCGESFFKRNTQQLFAYICGLKGKEILHTHQFPDFLKEDIPAVSKENTSLDKQTNLSAPDNGETSSYSEGLPLAPDAWNVLGDYFYPAEVPATLLSMRRFETKNKSKEIKINFSSKNKQPFLEKLKNTHRYHPARQTDCADGTILYETLSDGIYQAYLLSANAITVFSAAYNLPTLPEEPHAARMQQELCALDVNSKW